MRVLISVILLLSTVFVNAVNLDGFWQIGDDVEAADWDTGYQLEGDKFNYFRGSFNDLNPVIRVGGHFKVKNDSIYFKAEYFEIYNFNLVQFDEWPRSYNWYTERANYDNYDGIDVVRYYRYQYPETFSESILVGDKELTIGGEKYYYLPALPDRETSEAVAELPWVKPVRFEYFVRI